MTQFAVFRMQKGSGSSTGGMQGHNERSYDVKNADKERTHLNFYVSHTDNGINISSKNPRKGTYKSREDPIIENRTIKRKIQKNAVRRMSAMLTGSHDQMKKLEAEGRIKEWAAENYRFIGRKYGYENITEFVVHLDEETPHIHCIFVPIVTTEKGTKLSARDLNGAKRLTELQTQYGEAMKKFGLQRGLEGSRASYIDMKKHNANVRSEGGKLKEVRNELEKQVKELNYTKQNIEIEYNMIADAKKKHRNMQKHLDSINQEWNILAKKTASLEKEYISKGKEKLQELAKDYNNLKGDLEKITKKKDQSNSW